MKKEFAKMREKVAKVRSIYDKRFDMLVKASCEDMATAAAESTPPLNGEERGKNTITGDLAAHWDYEITKDGDKTRISLTNDLPYASYVDQGHKMDMHFVPWLYIDGMGVIARHIPAPGEKLFGLVVGTKTAEVKGYHMADKAKARFFKSFETAHENLIGEMGDILDGD